MPGERPIIEFIMRAGLEGFAGDLVGVSVTVQQRVLSFAWVYKGEVIWPTALPSEIRSLMDRMREFLLRLPRALLPRTTNELLTSTKLVFGRSPGGGCCP